MCVFLEEQSRIKWQVFQSIIQLKRPYVFMQEHKADCAGPSTFSLLSFSLGNSSGRTTKLQKYECWKKQNSLSTGSTPCCHWKSRDHLLQVSSVFFGAWSTTESASDENLTLFYWHSMVISLFMFSHSTEEHYFLWHSITNIIVINNREQHKPSPTSSSKGTVFCWFWFIELKYFKHVLTSKNTVVNT